MRYVRYINSDSPYIVVIVLLFINARFGINNDSGDNDFWKLQ